MICPACTKPYYFINATDTLRSRCLQCAHEDVFVHPIYDTYHDDLYVAKPYTRTIQTDPQMKTILTTLTVQPTDTVIDIGCGVGDYTKAIADFSSDVTGLDRSIDAAQKKYPNIQFRIHDCNAPLPFANESIDTIVSINLIEHLVDYENLLRECQRVLKSEGRIAITTANLEFILHDYFFDKTHVHEWTLKQFIDIISRYFDITVAEKSSSMFNYYPLNFITTKILKPDLLIIATKR